MYTSTRSIAHLIEEVRRVIRDMPEVKEIFFDDDTLTDNLPRVEAMAVEPGKLGVTWSCNAEANVPRMTLGILKENGLRLLLAGYGSGSQKILQWFHGSDQLRTLGGMQIAQSSHPHLPAALIFDKVEEFYRRFCFCPRKIRAIVGRMLRDFDMLERRLREDLEFFGFHRRRREPA